RLGRGRQVQELGPVQPDAGRPVLEDPLDVLGELDVGVQADRVPVAGDGRLGRDVLELPLVVDELLARLAVLGELFDVGVDDDVPAGAVDDDRVPAVGLVGDVPQPDDGRD